MAEIRSSLEIAMEKADKLGKSDKREMEIQSWMDKGRRLGAKYLRESGVELRKSMDDISPDHISHVLGGVMEVLIRNIFLPKDEVQKDTVKKAMKGLIEIKGSVVNAVTSQIEQLIDAYEQTKKHYYEQLKSQMQSQLGGVKEAMAMQYGDAMADAIKPDALPQFQEQWSKMSSEIDGQFDRQLSALKSAFESL